MKNLSLFILFFLSVSIFSHAQTPINATFFDQVDAFLKDYVKGGSITYDQLKDNTTLDALTQTVATADLSGKEDAFKQAFYINAYNLLVIQGAADAYPLSSVLEVGGFFDTQKKLIAGEKLTLNQLEKETLLKTYNDARFHFVLVCGAIGCPPITNFAYRPALLEQQLEQQTRLALNNPEFIQVNAAEQKVALSQIFEWYASDFGGNKANALAFINKYREDKIPADYKISFYTYDWSLNESVVSNAPTSNGGNNSSRYVVSSAIPKGTTETKIFNNLYSQQFDSNNGDGTFTTNRSIFFTSSLSFLYGVANKFNFGFDLRYRRVSNDDGDGSSFSVFGNPENAITRQGVTTIGPKLRWAPIETLPNFSVQSAFWIPIGDDLEGQNDGNTFIDWDGPTWFTQVFNDFSIGNNFSVFTEVDLFWEDIGSESAGDFNQFSTPLTLIFSYFPNPKTTIYTIGNYAPFWNGPTEFFAQGGVGAKYQFTPNIELELLYTRFTNDFLQDVNGRASTFNIGFRFNK